MEVWGWIVLVVVALIGGGVGGFFLARYLIQKQLKENPPISEKMVRTMLSQMGKKPSEKQVREIMRSMKQ